MEHYINKDYMKRCDVKSLYDETFETREWAGDIRLLDSKKSGRCKLYRLLVEHSFVS